MRNCKVCGDETEVVYNIRFKAVNICNRCGLTITKQEVASWKNKTIKWRMKKYKLEIEISFDEELNEKEILEKVEGACWSLEKESNIVEIDIDNVRCYSIKWIKYRKKS